MTDSYIELTLYLIISYFFLFQRALASEIILLKKDAVVWRQQQTITGKLSGFISQKIIVLHNGKTLSVSVKKDSTFSFSLNLVNKKNNIRVVAQNSKSTIISDTLRLTLGFHPLPVIKPYAVIHPNHVSLLAVVINNPTKKQLKYFWKDDARNPVSVKINSNNDSTARIVVPFTKGVYYFNLLVTAGKDSA